ncbi:MAG TPA: glycerophosphodiester phosphodiesterase family protein [Pyrinomonadaceae bacterium]|nr:glycerophosphodiester phosphodiesterase family protein [Pyrinomonadaceae bacterium]
MRLARRGFLKLFAASVGLIATKTIPFGRAQREKKSTLSHASPKILVAHRGASAYAPEHTLESYQLAVEQGADFVEQDLQITSDGVLVCLHDLTLERTTNVKEFFPTRYREELVGGTPARRWYVSDFSLSEIKQLDAGSWFNVRFRHARVPTFQEAIDLVRSRAGLYPETKAPEVYGQRGFDMERLVLEVLKKNGLDKRSAARHTPVIIQSFSPESLRKLSGRLKTELALVLLVGDESRTRWLTAKGLAESKQFASGIGPAKALVDRSLVMEAHALGLSVTPYTFRSSNTGRFKTVREEMSYYLYSLGVDALFTDNPDLFPRITTSETRRHFLL